MLAILLLLVGCGGSIQQPQPPQQSVIFFGDSIFGAWNLETYFPGKGYVNGGMFGYRTDQLKAALPDVLSGNVCHGLEGNATFPLTCDSVTPPRTIIIMAGWNNFVQGDSSNPGDDLQSMAAMATAKGVKVVICTVYAYDPAHPASWMAPTGAAPVTFYDMWRTPLNNNIGQMHGVTFVDFSALFDGQSDYTVDGIHPNDSGYAQMRDLINRTL